MPSHPARAAAIEARCAILHEYDVAAIVYRRAMISPEAQAGIDALGERTDIDELTVIRLPASGPEPCGGP